MMQTSYLPDSSFKDNYNRFWPQDRAHSWTFYQMRLLFLGLINTIDLRILDTYI